jgi:endonuclease YncB( thermonuclease family)
MTDASIFTRQAFIAVVTSILLLLPSAHAATPRSLVAKVDRVSDGDSMKATTSDGTKLRIRLLGIDRPEIGTGIGRLRR